MMGQFTKMENQIDIMGQFTKMENIDLSRNSYYYEQTPDNLFLPKIIFKI